MPIKTLFVLFGLLSIASAQQCKPLKASGATFPEHYYKACFRDFFNPKVTYRGIGSGDGVAEFLSKKVNFAGTDSPISPSMALHVPTVGGGVVIGFNAPTCSGLKLTQAQACAIFSGKIRTWSQLNLKGCSCNPNKLIVIVRKDSSGTTDNFTKSLKAFCGNYPFRLTGKKPNWPFFFNKADGNSGVASMIKSTKCSVGYIGYGTARSSKIPTAALQNKAKVFVKPTLYTIKQALGNIKVRSIAMFFFLITYQAPDIST